MFKATVRFGDVRVPVQLFSAVEDRKVHFRLLHAPDQEPLRQRIVEPVSGRVVPRGDVPRGYEVAPGTYVILSREELASIEPQPSRYIEVMRFVDPSLVDDRWYERPYFLGPDGSADAYFALAAAMTERGALGVARWVMRKQAYAGALRVEDGYLTLIRIRWADEVLTSVDLPRPSGRPPDEKELALADELIAALEAPFEPGEFHDEFEARVRRLVEAKAKGKKLPARKAAPEPRPVPSMVGALRRSLELAGRKKRAA
jgi:DNA end-binding protein Ku